jgi:hypothetical protein
VDFAPAPQFTGSSLALLAAVIAIFRRKRPIGGWLLYFFFQVVLGLALVFATTRWRRYLPDYWGDPSQYLLYAISNLPRIILLIAICALTLLLFYTRQRQWVVAVRLTLLAYAVVTLVKLLVDALYFPENVRLTAISLAFPCVWMVYFAESRRVHRVFE